MALNLTFKERVLRVVAMIARGQVLTYKEVARRAGSPQAYRAVGNILRHNYNPAIPCHRVVPSSGGLGNYNRGAARKRQLLQEEGALALVEQHYD
ncbi:MAG: MGMT family protein [Candidatus Andersenbacteria bacterium]